MSNTIVIGDLEEGLKWFGVAEHLKQQLKHLYNSKEALNSIVNTANTANTALYRPAWTVNPYMSTWKHVNDNVKVYIKMVNGHPQAFIYVDLNLGGFVLGLQNSTLLPEDLSKWKLAALLKDNLTTGVWSVRKQPYEISNETTPSALPYSITPNNEVLVTFKGVIYKALKSFVPAEEFPSGYFSGEPLYLDDNTVFLNQEKTIVPVINSLVDPVGWATRDDLKYEWTDDVIVADLQLGMLVTAFRYNSPPIIRRVGNEIKYYFLMMNETIANTIQRYQLTVNASLFSPYLNKIGLTTEYQEFDLGDFYQNGGVITTQGGAASAPLGGMDPKGLCKWSGGGGGALWSIAGLVGSGVYATSPNYYTSAYTATGLDNATITLDSGLEFKVKREMSAAATGGGGTTLFYGTNDTGDYIWFGQISPDRPQAYVPTSSSSEGTAPGAPIGDAGAIESGSTMSSNDTASTYITCEQLPADVQKTTHSSSRSGANVASAKYNKGYNDPATEVNWGGNPWLVPFTFSTTTSVTNSLIAFLNHSFNTTVEARDYIYCDLDEQVFMYIELVASGTYSNGVGSSEAVIRFCLDYRGKKFQQDIYSFNMASSIFVHQKYPDDVNFGTAPIEVRYTIPSPPMPKLIFAPTWTTQNQCPYIAYRTLSEIGSTGKDGKLIPDELLLSMRFQLIRERRALDDSPTMPTEAKIPPEGTVILKIPTIEHTCRTYGFQIKSLFTNLEMLWPTVTFSMPESVDWLANVLPETWPRPESSDEEPVDGIYTKNKGDLSTWHIYRT